MKMRMKRLIKRSLRALYRRTEFIRRPLRAELEALFKGCVATSFDEVRVVMEDLVIEVYWLRDEIDALKEEVALLREDDDAEATRSAA
jgi:hypothetical protein